jgi:hypothetical protein
VEEEHRARMAVIRSMHESVMVGLEGIQSSTSKVLQDQEQDLMRAFRARLQDVSVELDTQRVKKGDFSVELQARHRRVVAELHSSQELAQAFDKKNQQLLQENQHLMEKIQNREDDRQSLLKELVLAKREVTRLKSRLEEREAAKAGDVGALVEEAADGQGLEQLQVQSGAEDGACALFEKVLRSRKTIEKLRRDLEAERARVSDLTSQLRGSKDKMSELQLFVSQCLEEVKREMALRTKSLKVRPVPGRAVSEWTSQEREQAMRVLLSKERWVLV